MKIKITIKIKSRIKIKNPNRPRPDGPIAPKRNPRACAIGALLLLPREQLLRAFGPFSSLLPSWAWIGTPHAFYSDTMKPFAVACALTILLTVGSAAAATPGTTNGLILNFRDVPLRAVLQYLSDEAGLVVDLQTDVAGAVTLTASQPVSTAEAIELLRNQLSRHNYTAVLDGRTLTVMDINRARTDPLTPVVRGTDPALIPVDNVMATEILPVQTLAPAQLVKDLELLIPAGATVTASESGNAIIMTAWQKDIHRLATIISSLDGSAIAEVNVFPLDFADAKSVAAELKEVFQSSDSDVNRAGTRLTAGATFTRIIGSTGISGGDQKQKIAPVRPVFVADEQMNAVVASATPDIMPMVARVLTLLNKPGAEVTDLEIFPLLHADPEEVVNEITSLFASADGAGNADSTGRSMGIRFAGPGMMQPVSSAPAQSERLKRQSAVSAVADPRTQSVPGFRLLRTHHAGNQKANRQARRRPKGRGHLHGLFNRLRRSGHRAGRSGRSVPQRFQFPETAGNQLAPDDARPSRRQQPIHPHFRQRRRQSGWQLRRRRRHIALKELRIIPHVAYPANKPILNLRKYMKTHLSNALVILIVSLTFGVNGAPTVANSATATTVAATGTFILPPVGGAMNLGPVGGRMFPGAVGGTLSPGGSTSPLTPASIFLNGIPGGSLYFDRNGTLQNLAPLAPPGGILSGAGVGGVKSNVIVTGGTNIPPGGTLNGGGAGGVKSNVIVTGGANIPPGGTLSGGGVGGLKSNVIVTGGATSLPGGTLNAGGVGGALSSGTITGSASSVIVTGGSTN